MTTRYNAGVDPDINYYSDDGQSDRECVYMQEDSFIAKYGQGYSDYLSLLHFNIRSVAKHFEEMRLYLHTLKHHFSVLGLSETWVKDSSCDLFDLDSYNLYQNTRSEKRCGGVSIYIDSQYISKERVDLAYMEGYIETVFAEIDKQSLSNFNKNVVIGTVYRPPNTDIVQFNATLEIILNKIKSENKYCFLMGDFNIDLIKCDTHNETGQFLDLMFSNFYSPHVDKPTRITEHSSTLIDNIFSNMNSLDTETCGGILCTDITDHYPIFHFSKIKKRCAFNEEITTRKITTNGKEKFHSALQNCDWDEVLTSNNTQEAYNYFDIKMRSIFNQCFPKIRIKSKGKRNLPWINASLKRCIKQKNKLFSRFTNHRTCRNESIYKRYKKHLELTIRTARKLYYQHELTNNKRNLKKTWSVLRQVLNTPNKTRSSISFLSNDDECIADPTLIASKFNDFFTNIGQQICDSIPATTKTYGDYLVNPLENSIYIEDATEDEIIIIVSSLKNSSPGIDEIRADVVKSNIDLIVQPLTHLVNLSLANGYVPEQLKQAVVTPIHKGGNQCDINNYRPISVLPFFSKVFEKVMYNRIIDFLSKHDILYQYQFGFRKKMSTEMALAIATDKVSQEMDKGNNAIAVFLDLKKAFDTVNHTILLDKLYHYGIRGSAHQWFKSYLNNRKQSVKCNNVISEEMSVKTGIPQGSLLGPLIFILYINDLHCLSDNNNSTTIMFADDTSIFFSGPDLEVLINDVNHDLCLILEWLNANKLSLNISKTKAMLFSRKRNINRNIEIKVDNHRIDIVDSTTFLGVVIDKDLSWYAHIQKVCKKLSKVVGLLYRASSVLEKESLYELYNTLFYPHITYCNIIWGNAAACNLQRIYLLQKKAIRLICGLAYRDHTYEHFASLGILNIFQLNKYLLLMFVYKWLHHYLPGIFQAFYQISVRSSLAMRQSNALSIPYCTTSHHQSQFHINGIRVWNSYVSQENPNVSRSSFSLGVTTHLLVND